MHVEHLFHIYILRIEVYPEDKGVEIYKGLYST